MSEGGSKGRWVAFGARIVAVFSSGFLLAGAFPPWEQKEAAWLAIVPLVILARYTPPTRAFRWGWWSGVFFWLVTLSWLLRLADTGANWPLAILGWVSLSAALALYRGIFCMSLSWLMAQWRPAAPEVPDGGFPLQPPPMPRTRSLPLIFVIPALWVGIEYWRANLLSGFPWNLVGVSQFRNLALLQVAEWGGGYAVSYVVVLLNAAVALMLIRFVEKARQPVRKRDFQVEMFVGLLTVMLCWAGGGLRMQHWGAAQSTREVETVNVVAVQPNIKQTKKWDRGVALENLRKVEELTRPYVESTNDPDLVIWPETAVPGFVTEPGGAGEVVRRLAREGAFMLVGSLESEQINGKELLYNSSFLFGDDGEVVSRYRKQHLVPFGEYLPLENVFPFLKRFSPMGFSCSAGASSSLFRLRGLEEVPFSVLICFEDVMPYLSRRAVKQNARWLVVQTNDAWFDPSCGSLQHMSHCVLRAVENRVPIVRSANTGVTGFISPLGDFSDIVNSGGRITAFDGCGRDDVRPRGDGAPLTFYTRFGDLFFAMPCAILLLLVWVGALREHFRKPSGQAPIKEKQEQAGAE